jgi:hypothetical protein
VCEHLEWPLNGAVLCLSEHAHMCREHVGRDSFLCVHCVYRECERYQGLFGLADFVIFQHLAHQDVTI